MVLSPDACKHGARWRTARGLIVLCGMHVFVVWLVAAVLVLLWLLGVTGAIPAGGWIHLLLVAAVIALGASVLTRPRVV